MDVSIHNNVVRTMESMISRAISLFGLFAMVAFAWLMSRQRRAFPWRVVSGGLLLQFGLAVLVLRTPQGRDFFNGANAAVGGFQQFVNEGSSFVFGLFPDSSSKVGNERLFLLNSFVFGVLPTVIVFSSLMSVLYHVGVMQLLVHSMAWVMQRTLGTSGPESLAAAANIFVGHTEAPLVVRPFLDAMTRSELNAMMVGGFATITGSLIAAYHQLGMDAGHLITACVISAPAALLIAKVMEPEAPGADVNSSLKIDSSLTSVNLIGAAAQGASDGMKLALNIAAMLIAFLALIALADFLIGWLGSLVGIKQADGTPLLSLSLILSYLFSPLAWLIGVPWSESLEAGRLLGIKMVANEFVAYEQLGTLTNNASSVFSERTKILLTYALCGFSNFGAIGIQVGGIGGLAPSRRDDIARLGLRAMLGGTLACLMTACVAGILI